MNELYIGSMHCYLKTNANTKDEAEREFEEACRKVGIEIGAYDDTELRDEDGEVINDYGYIDELILEINKKKNMSLPKRVKLKTALIEILG